MFNKENKSNDGILKSIVFAYLILILHLVLFAALGLLVIFINGMVQYMIWIMLGGMMVVGISAYLFYRRVRREGESLSEALRSPVFQGRQVEVSLLGGMATFKLDRPGGSANAIASDGHQPPLQLEDPEMARIREINALAQLLEKDLISIDEFNNAKQRLFSEAVNSGQR